VKTQNIHLDETGTPDEITVTMTLGEAILMTSHVGQLVPATKESTGIWDALQALFCRFWDDGLDDAKRGKLADS